MEFLLEASNRSYHLLSTRDDSQLHKLLRCENHPITLLTCHPKTSQTVISSTTTNITWQKPEAITDWVTRRPSSDGNILLFTLTTLPDSKSSLASIKKQIHEAIFKNASSSMFIIIDEKADLDGLGSSNGLQVTLGEMLVLLDVCARDRISALTGRGYCDISVSGSCVWADGERDKNAREGLVVTCQNTTTASTSSSNSSSSSNNSSSNSSTDKISPDMKIGSDGGGRERIASIAAKVLGLSGSSDSSSNSDSSSCSSSGDSSNSNGDSSSNSSGNDSIIGTIVNSDTATLIAFVSRFADSVARDRLTKVTTVDLCLPSQHTLLTTINAPS